MKTVLALLLFTFSALADESIFWVPAGLWPYCKANHLTVKDSPMCMQTWEDGKEPFVLWVIPQSSTTMYITYKITGTDPLGKVLYFEGGFARNYQNDMSPVVVNSGILTKVSITVREFTESALYTVQR